MKKRQESKVDRPTTTATQLPAPGLRVAMMLLVVLALAVGFATAKAQPADGAVSVADGWSGYENQPYRVNIWHDKGDEDIYERGEAVRIHFETNSDAYAVVYRIDTDGAVSILWPRSRYDDGFVFGHHTYNLPTPGAQRIRTASEEGVEYVQAIVSAYPFDLRGLDVDFHHEDEGESRAYFVAGDPFLAMNDINYAVTGLDDAADFVVTNYLSYYVHRQVEHPRYMCTQCHDNDTNYHPYNDVCVVEIHHDYSWDNNWFDTYRYYPAYYYPVYYYVDPWTMRPWINYWYSPWYVWPTWGHSVWGYDCYVWNYSPYWRGDVWVRYKDGNRRHRPITKDHRYADARGDREYNHPRGIVKTPRPTRDMVVSMNDRSGIRKDDQPRSGHAISGRGDYKDTGRAVRPVAGFTKKPRDVRAPGIRVPSGDRRSETERLIRPNPGRTRDGRTPTQPAVRSDGRGGRTPTRVSPGTKPDTRREDGRAVRPVKPHSQGSRIWQGGSRDQSNSGTVKPGSDRGSTRSTPTVKPRSERAVKPARKPETVKPSRKPPSRSSNQTVKPSRKSSGGSSSQSVKPSRKSSSGSSNQSVKPRSNSGNKSSGSTGSRSSGSSSRSKGGGKSNSSRSNRR